MGYNKYNSPGWAEGFNSTRDALQNYEKDKELAADADAPDPTDPTVDPGKNLGLISVANPNNMGPQQSEADGGERVDLPNVMAPAPAAAPGLANAPPTTASAAAASAAKAQRRATIYRRYGDDGEADKLLSNDASLGLVSAQTRGATAAADLGETHATDARRTSADAQAINDVNKSVAQQIKDAGIDTSTAEGGIKANKLRQDGLIKAGQFGEAKIAGEQLLSMQTNAVKSQTESRQVAANAIVMASRAGTLTADSLGAFHDEFIPDGAKVRSTTMNKDGGFTMILADSNGKESTQTVAGKDMSNMYGMLGSADASAAIVAQLKAKGEQDLNAAHIVSLKAAAGASGAAAAHSNAQTADIRQTTAQKAIENKRGNDLQAAREAENSEAGSTDEQYARIGAADDANVSWRARRPTGDLIPLHAAQTESKANTAEINGLKSELLTASAAKRPAIEAELAKAKASRVMINEKLAAMGSPPADDAPGLSTVAKAPAGAASAAPAAGAAKPGERPPLSIFQSQPNR